MQEIITKWSKFKLFKEGNKNDMIIIRPNEIKYAETCIKYSKIDSRDHGFTLGILANYFYSVVKYRKNKVEEMLIEFVRKACHDYASRSKHYDELCKRYAKSCGGRTLIALSGVNVTNAELKTIKGIKGKSSAMLAFTLLCLYKIEQARGGKWISVKYPISDIVALANVRCNSNAEAELMLSGLYADGLIDYTTSNNIIVKFAGDFGVETDDDIAITISDFRNVGYQYLKLIGQNVNTCSRCGIVYRRRREDSMDLCKVCANTTVKKTIVCIDCGKPVETDARANRQVRCPDCQKIKVREYEREKKRRQRSRV